MLLEMLGSRKARLQILGVLPARAARGARVQGRWMYAVEDFSINGEC